MCPSGVVELRTGTLGVFRGGRATYWFDTQGTNMQLYYPSMTTRVPVRSTATPNWQPGYQYAALPPLNDTQGTSTQLYQPWMTLSLSVRSSTSPELHLGYQYAALLSLNGTRATST